VFGAVALASAWICDDAYITFRTIENVLMGHGLVWNVGERVQSYTHPLWLLLMLALRSLTGEFFFTSMLLSCALSTAAVAVVATLGRGVWGLLAVGLVLGSKAFVDFSCSGLENPLAHLLLAAFGYVFLVSDRGSAAFSRRLGVLAGLIVVTRYDFLLLVLPALGVAAREVGRKDAVRLLRHAAVPMASWVLFATFYYGTPIPNTAFAKLDRGLLDFSDIARLGVRYLVANVRHDAVTFGTILYVSIAAAAFGERRARALAGGACVYVGYVVLGVGGDYMLGRFLSSPFLVAIALGAHMVASKAAAPTRSLLVGASAVTALAAVATPLAPLRTLDGGWVQRIYPQAAVPLLSGFLHDERAHFFTVASLRHAPTVHPDRSPHRWADAGRAIRGTRDVHISFAIGFLGFYAGAASHVLDPLALSDAFLAQLPFTWGVPGHHHRPIPEGYVETLATGRNQLQAPELRRLYDDVAAMTRNPLIDTERWRAALRLTFGSHRGAVAAYAWHTGAPFSRRVVVSPVYGELAWVSLNGEAIGAAGARQLDLRVDHATAVLSGAGARLVSTLNGVGALRIRFGFVGQRVEEDIVLEAIFGYRADGALTVARHPILYRSVGAFRGRVIAGDPALSFVDDAADERRSQ